MAAKTRELSDYANKHVTRNAIINGNMDVWQREINAGASTGNKFVADRWLHISTNTTSAVTREEFPLGQTDVPHNPRYFQRSVISSVAGAGNFSNLRQRIEGVETFAGTTATLSFWAKADSLLDISTEIKQDFGTGGSPSPVVLSLGVTTHNLTTAWQKFEVVIDIPSIIGSTKGTNNDDRLTLLFWFDAGSNFDARTNSLGQQSGTIDIAQVQLESGSIPTEFENRSITQELLLCQRYFCKSYSIDVLPGTPSTLGMQTMEETNISNTAHNVYADFPVSMRALPTMVSYSTSGGGGGVVLDVPLGGNRGVASFVGSDRTISAITLNSAATGTGSNANLQFQWTADAEI